MTALFLSGNVRTKCPDCGGALSTYEFRQSAGEFGTVIREGSHEYKGGHYSRIFYKLMRCGGCGRGGLATVHLTNTYHGGLLEEFYPSCLDRAVLPSGVPDGVVSEFREAETCASVAAWRAGSAMLRSAMEKTLKANGYLEGNLRTKIDEAARDGAITAARQRRAHDDIRVLGNDILHEEWRPVDEEEFNAAHHYVQRIIEDFYDHRAEVEAILIKAGRRSP